VTDGSLPDILRAPRARRSGQWVGLSLVAVAMAAATVLVPPLITPPDSAAPAPSSSAAVTPSSTAVAPSSALVAPQASASSALSAARFTPVTIQAEDPGNLLTGGASVVTCATCHGGGRVRYLCNTCTLVVRTALPVAGSRTITVGYEVDGPRFIKVSINGAPASSWPVTGPEWTVPQTFRFTAQLPAGDLRLTFFNDESPAPDIDDVIIA